MFRIKSHRQAKLRTMKFFYKVAVRIWEPRCLAATTDITTRNPISEKRSQGIAR